MFVLEYIKKKNFLNKKKEKIIIETDIVEDEDLNLAKFKEEIGNEIGAIVPEENQSKREDN